MLLLYSSPFLTSLLIEKTFPIYVRTLKLLAAYPCILELTRDLNEEWHFFRSDTKLASQLRSQRSHFLFLAFTHNSYTCSPRYRRSHPTSLLSHMQLYNSTLRNIPMNQEITLIAHQHPSNMPPIRPVVLPFFLRLVRWIDP